MDERPPAPDAAYFDRWYADMASSPTRDALVQRTLGLPPSLRSTSLLPWDGIAVVVDALRPAPGDVLLDLACGRGGYGLEVAQRTGARLVGVDFSAVALRTARAVAPTSAALCVGTLTATGVADRSVQAAMCIDAVQFAEPPLAAVRELRRVLAPGGRVALTCWEALDRARADLPPRLRTVDLERDLLAAGFADVVVTEQPGWQRAERAMWEAAVAAPEDGDPAMRALREEGVPSLALADAVRRVLATATSPG